MSQITLTCCDGNEQYPGQCLKDRCPRYADAKRKVQESWPYTGTGFGNLYGNPMHAHFLAKVKSAYACEKATELCASNIRHCDCLTPIDRCYCLTREEKNWLKEHFARCQPCRTLAESRHDHK